MAGMDDIFTHLGPWHYPVIIFCFLRGLPTAYHIMAPTFIAPTLEHWCAKPPQLKNWTDEEWMQHGIPHTGKGTGSQELSRCEMFGLEEAEDGSYRILNDTRLPCSSWHYEMGDNINTLTNEFDLVCERVWLRAASQSIFMAGLMVGNIIFAHLSDWYGRKRALLFALPLPLACGVLTAFSPSYLVYNLGRFAASIGIGGLQNSTFTLIIEVIATRHRAVAALIYTYGWTTGLVTLTAFAWYIRNWMHLQLVISLFYIIHISVLFFLPESPRWLLATRNYGKADKILKSAIRKNKVKDVDVDDLIKSMQEKMEREKMSAKPTFVDLFRYRCIRRTTYVKAAMGILSTLLSYNLTYSIILVGSNPFASFALMGAMGYPVKIVSVFFTNYLKRRTSYGILYSYAFICSLAAIFLPRDPWWLQVIFVLQVKLGSSCASTVLFVQRSELYPTKVRTLATGFMIMASRVGAMTAPFTKESGVIIGPWAPRVVDCCTCLCLLVLGLLLPETFKLPLPDNIEDIKSRSRKSTTPEAVTMLRNGHFPGPENEHQIVRDN
ncbi:organic cation transporter protein [Ixodes scapularis]|uniref:organic cation transporter protein n=1 Tax=Ixodes scapularis TaxID=6945 RepID=UPI001A9D94D5|nr:organic cation transporter protein [Ixodes scapularis]